MHTAMRTGTVSGMNVVISHTMLCAPHMQTTESMHSQ